MRLRLSFILIIVLLAACESAPAPTLTPTRQLSGPTIAPTQALFNGPPTEGPPQQAGSVGMSDPTAAALPNQGAMPPIALGTPSEDHQEIEVAALDGLLLPGQLFQSDSGTRQPGILLLGNSGAAWGIFPQQLAGAGFTVLVMQARDESDVEVMLETLGSGIADPARIAVIGAATGADLALRGCAITPSCDAAVLLSPQDENALLNVLLPYDLRPLLLIASDADSPSIAVARSLEASAVGDTAVHIVASGQGSAILSIQPETSGLIIDWLQQRWGT